MKTDEKWAQLSRFYRGDIPPYVRAAGRTYFTINISDFRGKQRLKITINDVIDYYATQARNISSGIRILAGYAGDWRMVDRLAKEALEWFKLVNRPALVRVSRRHNMELRR